MRDPSVHYKVLKLLLIIFCVITTTLSWSQSHWFNLDVQKSIFPEFSISDLDQEISDSEKTELMIKICLLGNHCDFCVQDSSYFAKSYREYLEAHAKSIHFIDLDRDGDHDIIFSGKECEGIDGGLVEIYKNESDTLIRKFKSEGTLINFNIDSLKFAIYDYPCCAQQTHIVIEYKFDNENFTLVPLIGHQFVGNSTVLGGPYFPKQQLINDPYTFSNEIALRWSANTTDSDPTMTCKNSKTNIICTYSPKSTGTILLRTSEQWMFVKMDYVQNATNACSDNYVPYLNSIPVYYYGWVIQ